MSEKNYRLDFDQVRASANGRWSQIYGAFTGFQAALELASKNRHTRHAECPVCTRKNFRLFKDFHETGGGICTCGHYPDGFMLLRAVKGYGPNQTYDLFKEVSEILGGEHASEAAPPPAISKPAPRKLNDKVLADLQAVHRELLPVSDPRAKPLRSYLTHRGINPTSCPHDVRFHPGLRYLEEQEDGTFKDLGMHPAMVGIVRTRKGAIVTLHRTYLSVDGRKAAVPEPKKLMPKAVPFSVAGCCIQLDPATEVVHVVEGIETGLSVRAITGEPTWVAISANYLPAFAKPAGVRRIVLWVDLDRSGAGNRFSQELADRLLSEGVCVEMYTPHGPIPMTEKSVDWNDIHRSLGRAGFPAPYQQLQHEPAAFEGSPQDC